jgi:peptidoglycan LD-endopeptidase CwlK
MSRSAVDLAPDVAAMWLEHERRCALKGIDIELTQTFRTPIEQTALYDQGRKTPGPPCIHDGVIRPVGSCPRHPLGLTVTAAPAGYSFHEFRRAYDVGIKTFPGDLTPKNWYDGPWGHIGEIGEACGLDWGGRWKRQDLPHFEHHGGRTLAQWRAARAVPAAIGGQHA